MIGSGPEMHDDGESQLSFRDKISNIMSVATEDFRSTNWRGKAIIAGMIFMGFYEWGPGNETVAPIITGQSLDVADGIGGIALTAVIGGSFVGGQQLLSGFLARKTAKQFPKVGETAFSYFNNEEGEELKYKHFDELSNRKKWLYSFSLGSSFTVAREALVAGNDSDDELKKVSRKSSLISSLSVAAFGAGVDVINQQFPDNEALQTTIDWTVKNPLFWIGVTGLSVAIDKRRSKQ